MRAAVLYGPSDLRLNDVPRPIVGEGEVLIRVAHNGICGSDLKMLEMGLRAVNEPHPLTGHFGPQILGHEFAGTVVEIGAGASFSVGDRVCVQPNYHCGECPPCRAGLFHLCRIITFHGVTAGGGGLSEYTALPASMVHAIPDSMTFAQGALVEPMAVSLHAVGRADTQPGECAAIFGAGPIGIGVFFALRDRGIDDVVFVEPSAHRRRVVEQLGAVAVEDADRLRVYFKQRNRSGADSSFDCAGVPSAFNGTLESLRVRGTAVIVAGSSAYPLSMTAHLLQHTEIRITGSLAFEPDDFRAVIARMASGGFATESWVDHIAFDELVEEGFGALKAGRRTKVLVDINANY